MFSTLLIAYLITGGFRIAHVMRFSPFMTIYKGMPLLQFGTLYFLTLIFWMPMMVYVMLFRKVKKKE